MTDAPSSRVSSVVSTLGDFTAFCASFLTLGDVIAAGALAIPQFYAAIPATYRRSDFSGTTLAKALVHDRTSLRLCEVTPSLMPNTPVVASSTTVEE